MKKLSCEYILTSKFAESENPYEHDTRPWHIWLDISSITNLKAGESIDIDRMLEVHGTNWNYYKNYIGELVEDGLLELVYFKDGNVDDSESEGAR